MINQDLLAPQPEGVWGRNEWMELPFLLLLRWEGKTPSDIPSAPGRDSLCTCSDTQTKSCTSPSFNPCGGYNREFSTDFLGKSLRWGWKYGNAMTLSAISHKKPLTSRDFLLKKKREKKKKSVRLSQGLDIKGHPEIL